MAYEVTATRKRPQTFEQMMGQDFVVTTLKASLENDKIAHAYLFSGPRGVGKTSAARILAKSLNCESGPTATPCGTCGNCLEITRGNSLDVIEIDGASNTSVNDVREIKNEVLFSPSSSRYKIYIIDEVHMLSNSAFNALLKTIEEPPPYVIFVFATTEVHKVPATIRSRCQQFVFRLISIEVIKTLLEETAVEGGISAEDEALFWIAKEATGSLRDAYTLFDQVSSFSDGNITMVLIREKLGSVGLDTMNEIVELLVDGKVKEALEIAGGTLYRGVSVDQFVIDLAEYFRCLLFLRHGIDRESLLGYATERFSKKVLGVLNEVQIEKGLELVFQLYRDLRYSLNQRFELELVLSRLSALTAYVSQKELLSKISELRTKLISGDTSVEIIETEDLETSPTVVASADTPTITVDAPAAGESIEAGSTVGEPAADLPPQQGEDQTASAAVVDGDLSNDQREAIMSSIRKKHLSLASSLEKVTSWRLENESLVLTCGSNFDAANIRREQKKILEAVAAGLGKPYRIELISDRETNEGAKNDSPTEEGVEMIRRVFRGEIVDDA
jgi:DNA polymerase III subunit gamma/tau